MQRLNSLYFAAQICRSVQSTRSAVAPLFSLGHGRSWQKCGSRYLVVLFSTDPPYGTSRRLEEPHLVS